jgi:hypothetical protein
MPIFVTADVSKESIWHSIEIAIQSMLTVLSVTPFCLLHLLAKLLVVVVLLL